MSELLNVVLHTGQERAPPLGGSCCKHCLQNLKEQVKVTYPLCLELYSRVCTCPDVDWCLEYLTTDRTLVSLLNSSLSFCHIIIQADLVRVVRSMSLHTVLSESEREYILCGIKEGVRADGRGCRDVRHFSLRLGVVSNTSGSALIERVCVLYMCMSACT